MRRRFNFGAILFLITLIACNKGPSEIGAGFVSGQPFDVSVIDTVLIRASTMTYDSLATSYSGRLLAGHHVDPKLGGVTSYPVFLLTPPSSPRVDPDYTDYVKLTLHLTKDGYSYYDTLQPITLKVYRLSKKLEIFNGYRYNVDPFEYDKSAPLGTLTFLPSPKSTRDSVDFSLPDDLGQQLFAMAQSKEDVTLSSSFDFEQFFHGLVLVPDTLSSGAMMGFKPNVAMRLYYRNRLFFPTPGASPDKFLAFPMLTSTLYYNKIDHDRSATKLAGLVTSTQAISSQLTDNEVYIEGGVGLAMRIELPYIKNLSFLQSNFRATRATLTFTPVDGYLQDITTLPPYITADLIDGNNQTIQVNVVATKLVNDQFFNASYSLDLTNFINSQILSAKNNNALLLRLQDATYRSSMDRLAVGDQSSSMFRMKLNVYYITITDQ